MKTVDRLSIYLPWLGGALLLGGSAAYFVTRRFDLLPNLLLAGGGVALLLFAILRPDDIRQRLSGRAARYGTSTMLSTLFFLATIIILYIVAYQNNDWRLDATETNDFTPLPETIELLNQLSEPVHVIGFYTFNLAFQQDQAAAALQSLQAYKTNLTYEFVDPDENPLRAEPYDLTFDGTLVFTRGSGDNETFAKASSLSDRDIHTALLRLLNPVAKKAYYLVGHGEPDTADFALEGLATAVQLTQEAGFEVEDLNLLLTGSVPEDATAVILIGQAAPLAPEEVAAIDTYLQNGGSLFLAREVIDSEGRARVDEDALTLLLRDNWGIVLRDDAIIEQTQATAGQTFGLTFLAASFGSHAIIRDAGLEQFGTLFELARSIDIRDNPDVQTVPLVQTSDQAWGETDFANLTAGFAQPDSADASGPLTFGTASENLTTGARLVVFGDASWLTNGVIGSGGNNLLYTNALNWLANDQLTAELTPRTTVNRQLIISQTQLGLLQLVSVCLGPGIMALIGLGVWYNRRQKP